MILSRRALHGTASFLSTPFRFRGPVLPEHSGQAFSEGDKQWYKKHRAHALYRLVLRPEGSSDKGTAEHDEQAYKRKQQRFDFTEHTAPPF